MQMRRRASIAPLLLALGLLAIIFSSGATFGGGGQSTAGPGLPELSIRLISGAEYASRTSYHLGTSNTVASTQDHALELIWQYANSPQTSPPGATGSTAGTGQAMVVTRAAGVQPAGVGTGSTATTGTTGTTGSTTGSTSGGTTGGCGGYTYSSALIYNYVYVDSPSGGAVALGTNPGSTVNVGWGNSPISISLDGAYQLLYLFNPGSFVAIEWHATGTLAGGSFKFHVVNVSIPEGSNDDVNWTVCGSATVTDKPYTITVAKDITQATAIDSRNAYSDADTPPTDANKSGRNLNFSSNIYMGGAFVGNMGSTNSQSDRSGTARLQIYPGLANGALSNYQLVIASMLHIGTPSYANGDMQVGAYCPASSDPNLPGTSGAASIGTVTWASQWLISPRTTIGSPPDYTKDPVTVTNLLGSGSNNQGSAIGDYASFDLTAVYDMAYTNGSGGTSYSTVAITPATAGQGICIAAYNEASYISNNTTLFHWLMNPAYPITGLAFPYSDAQPRLWLISGTGVN